VVAGLVVVGIVVVGIVGVGMVVVGLVVVGAIDGLAVAKSLKYTLNVMVSPETLILLMVTPVSRIIPPL